MRHTYFAASRDSNSWHILVICEQSHYEGDDEVTEFIEMIEEYDVGLGGLEAVIDKYGIERMYDMDTALMLLKSFPYTEKKDA